MAGRPRKTGPGLRTLDPARRITMADGHPLKVLIVDDDMMHRYILRALLEAYGYHPREARDGREALAVARTEAFDLVIMDLDMPVMDGIEATRRILHDAPIPPRIIALTGAPVTEEASREAGLTAMLMKPPCPEELKAQLLCTRSQP